MNNGIVIDDGDSFTFPRRFESGPKKTRHMPKCVSQRKESCEYAFDCYCQVIDESCIPGSEDSCKHYPFHWGST